MNTIITNNCIYDLVTYQYGRNSSEQNELHQKHSSK
jgi:hypothetical protein